MPGAPETESERQTRKQRIDPRLRAAGWDIVLYRDGQSLAHYERCAVEEFPTDNGPADYALCLGGQVLAVVEGKRVTLGPQNVLTQAERIESGPGYPRKRERPQPFCYNGGIMNDRITIDPAVLVGKPVIKGTRLSVEFILGLLAQGWSVEDVLKEYDHITRDDVLACLAYAHQILVDEKLYPAPV